MSELAVAIPGIAEFALIGYKEPDGTVILMLLPDLQTVPMPKLNIKRGETVGDSDLNWTTADRVIGYSTDLGAHGPFSYGKGASYPAAARVLCGDPGMTGGARDAIEAMAILWEGRP